MTRFNSESGLSPPMHPNTANLFEEHRQVITFGDLMKYVGLFGNIKQLAEDLAAIDNFGTVRLDDFTSGLSAYLRDQDQQPFDQATLGRLSAEFEEANRQNA